MTNSFFNTVNKELPDKYKIDINDTSGKTILKDISLVEMAINAEGSVPIHYNDPNAGLNQLPGENIGSGWPEFTSENYPQGMIKKLTIIEIEYSNEEGETLLYEIRYATMKNTFEGEGGLSLREKIEEEIYAVVEEYVDR